jgi:predicted HD superfamily hydrolase involved in NAD metabolism
LPTWRSPEIIFEKAAICLVRREEDGDITGQIQSAKEKYEREFGARIHIVDAPVKEISSSDLRRDLCSAPWRAEKALSPAVYSYIRKEGLWPARDRDALLSSLREDVRAYMSEKRYRHTLGVEKMVLRMSSYFEEIDPFYIRAAALLHDITKELSEAEHRAILSKMQMKLSESQQKSPAILHSFTAEDRIKKEFSYFGESEQVISAIRAHTTGCAKMSLFDKILFVADYIEEGREYSRCMAAREYFFSMIESGIAPIQALNTILLQIFESTIRFLNERGFSLCEDTVVARDEVLSTITSN